MSGLKTGELHQKGKRSHLEDIGLAGVSCALVTVDSLEIA